MRSSPTTPFTRRPAATPRSAKRPIREPFAAQLAPGLLQDVRSCLQTGTPLGNDRLRLHIEQALGVRVGYSRQGRPKNPAAGSGQALDKMELSL